MKIDEETLFKSLLNAGYRFAIPSGATTIMVQGQPTYHEIVQLVKTDEELTDYPTTAYCLLKDKRAVMKILKEARAGNLELLLDPEDHYLLNVKEL